MIHLHVVAAVFCCCLFVLGCATPPAQDHDPNSRTSGDVAQEGDPDDVLGNNAQDSDSSDNLEVELPDTVTLTLPASVERIVVDRFLRDRRTLMVKFLPLEPAFKELHVAFMPRNTLSRDVEGELRRSVLENRQRSHWLFLHGALELQETLANVSRPLLIEEQKAVLAHYGRTLLFLAKTLDSAQEPGASRAPGRYTLFFRQLYKALSARYLYRELKERDTKQRQQRTNSGI
jgi:hypothetical protein